jgi:hypothetical protein
MGARISYKTVCLPVDEQAESFQKPRLGAVGSRHNLIIKREATLYWKEKEHDLSRMPYRMRG